MRDFHSHPGHKFGEAIRNSAKKVKNVDDDRELVGKGKPHTGQAGMPRKIESGSAGNRPGKANHPSGTVKADAHRIKGKVKRIEMESAHGGHKVRITYHHKKSKKGEMPSPYVEPEEHVHTSAEAAKAHVNDAIDHLEPEEMDSSDLADKVY